jgi:hypothetical protein
MRLRPKYFIAVSRKEYIRRMTAKWKQAKLIKEPPKPVPPPPTHQWDTAQLVCQVCGAKGGPGSWESFNPCVTLRPTEPHPKG